MATSIHDVEAEERALIGRTRTPDDLPEIVKTALAADTGQRFDDDGQRFDDDGFEITDEVIADG